MKRLLLIFFVAWFAGLGAFPLWHRSTSAADQPEKKKEGIPIIPDVPKDAIPPLDFPQYESPQEASWLQDDDIVLGVEFNNDARAYPIRILNWHEIVNERIGGKDVLVSYCPLCRSGILFGRHLEGRLLTFGNTGALYESDMVMYDRQTESFWFQVAGRGIRGPLKGKELTLLPSFLTTWKQWRGLYPATKVLSRKTGFARHYELDPYRNYDVPNSLPAFPVSITDSHLPNKEKVIGLVVNHVSKAYPVKLVQGKTIQDKVNGQRVEIVGDQLGISARVFYIDAGRRKPAPSVATYWFAWYAAHPNTLIFRGRGAQE
jgi:hypothetical protein